ncbi:RNA polymerase III subunit RPC82-domain-containing protein [Irpex rosettiformis]|uniref:RNA polymerase III subunit RPC82-domain-containing protein n=1 Tax=Irpex rosettiformis TaxID=378272 RepID=A0ACB8TW94_9APHY|nr:RNA polymerase III subunit RPC82-domain-containing protein [Irpex rosettiformis]
MTDTNTSNLCEQIIATHFGPLTTKVAHVLLHRGRLPLSQIIRFSGLKPRTARAAIIVLVQHNILWHAQSDTDGEVFEVNTDECLMRLRYGRFVWQAEQLYGKAGAEVVQLILDHGKLRPPEIISQLSIYDPVKGPSIYSQALHKLVENSYLKPSTILSHVSPRDRRIKYEAEEKAKISGFPTAKQLKEVKEVASARIKREEEDAEKIGMKRKAKEHSGRPGKRKAVDEEAVDDGVFFRVNSEKFNIHIRNKMIEDSARERYNDQAALVMRAVLKATETKQLRLTDTLSDPTSLANVSMSLSEDDDLSGGLATSSKHPSQMSLLKDYCAILAAADNPSHAGKAGSFLSVNGSKLQVEFEIIATRLRRRILEAITRERHGDEGVRIVCLLLSTGKMDEKQISKVGMMDPKDVRPLLTAMAAESIVSLQEVAKSADRNPARTFFLWYVDLQKAYAVIISNLYKTLHNIVRRRQVEEEEPLLRAVLDKRQRSDVSQDEERLLTRNEREMLAKWEKKCEKLTVLEMRVEESVFILRDMGTFAVNDD